MGYIKKLKNNELVGGTDKTTIYPVTSTEAVFEEITEGSESNFKSQKFLNNNITGDRINEGTITDYNIAVGTVTKGKLSSQVQTMLDEGQKKALTPKGDYDAETVYEALDLVFDKDSNSSYVSLITPNTEPLTNEDAWEMFLDGTAVNTAQATINAKVDVLDAQVDEAIGQAQQDVQDLIDETAAALQAATDEANDAAGEARNAASTVETLTSQQVADAQIGYFTCTDTAASGAAANETKITTTDTIGVSTYTKTVGSHVKVKMAVANTHAAPVYIQFGSNTANKAQLYYNGEPASASNSWDDNETISVYYDGTYYQASNALGGGSAVGKKVINPTATNRAITTNGDTIGAVITSGVTNWCYAKYAVNEGDVVQISGTGGNISRLWAIADASENILRKEETTNATREDFALVMPAGAKWIVLNNNGNEYPDYKWYYAKAGSVGAHEMLTDAYLLGDLRTLAVGQTYEENEAVKTTDKQLLRVTKDVKAMNLTDEVASGYLKAIASGTYAGTYKAQKNVKSYTDTTYADGAYALGSPAGAIIQVTVDSTAIAALEEATDISVTIAGIELTVAVDSTMDAVAVAAAIVTAFGTQNEWKLVDNSDGTINLISKIAKTEAPTISSDTGETGVTVGFVESSDYAGTTALSKYDGTAWTVVTDLDTYASDFVDIGETDATKMWKKLDTTDLTTSYTKQNSVADDFLYNSNAFISENLFNLKAARISDISNTSYSTSTKDTDTNTIQITVSVKDNNHARNVIIWPFILKAGKKYRLSFTYANGMNAVITPTLRSYNNALIGNIVDINNHTLSLPIGSGSVDCIFIPKQNSERLCITYPAATGVNKYIKLIKLFIGEVYSVTELAEKHNEDIEKSIKDTNNIIDINPMSYNKSLYIEPDYTWNKSTTGYSHYAIPAKSGERFVITPGERFAQYGFLTSPNGTSGADVTTWLPGYETLYTIPVGETKEIFIPENEYNTIYIYILHLNNSGLADYTPASIQKYVPAVKDSEAIHNNLDSLNDAVAKLESTVTRLDLTEKDEDGITYKTYTGNPLIPVYNKFGWKNIGPTATYRTEQACSIWGDYAFGFDTAENNGSCALDIVNLKTRKTVGAYKGSRVYNIPTDGNYHMGSSQFSNIYYDENDEFPLIYIQGITSNLIVGRVVPENSAQLYHIEIVQVIDYSGITDNNITYHVAFDHTRGYLVLFNGAQMKIKTLLPPAIKDGSGNYITNVSITDADFIEQYEISGYTQVIDMPQSGSCHNGLLFYVNGIVRTEQRLIVIDLRTHAVVNDVSTWQLIKDVEPESIDFWGEIPILFTREGMFRLWF